MGNYLVLLFSLFVWFGYMWGDPMGQDSDLNGSSPSISSSKPAEEIMMRNHADKTEAAMFCERYVFCSCLAFSAWNCCGMMRLRWFLSASRDCAVEHDVNCTGLGSRKHQVQALDWSFAPNYYKLGNRPWSSAS